MVAEFARGLGGPTPKSLDSHKNFKPEHTLFCRKLRFVAIYAYFAAKMENTRLTKNFIAISAPNERLPSSAYLALIQSARARRACALRALGLLLYTVQ